MHLTKHHGLGNDFLVLLDLDGTQPMDRATAVALCHRHTGLGADGLIRVTAGRGPAAVAMELFQRDGSVAEMSGNGIRALAQAVARAGMVAGPTFSVETPAGLRTVELRTPTDSAHGVVAVDMGEIRPGLGTPDNVTHELVPKLSAIVDVGNPHLVLLLEDAGSLATLDPAALGPAYQEQFPATGGINVEWIAAARQPDTLDLIVFERGAGVTRACGTGACAAAWAAHGWGLVGTTVIVEMPGGAVTVGLDGPAATLVGPVHFVASIDVHPAELA